MPALGCPARGSRGRAGKGHMHRSAVFTCTRAGTPGLPGFLQASSREAQARVPSGDALAWWQAEGRQGSLPMAAPK